MEFVDAQKMAIENPITFEAPSKDELGSLKDGSIVKVSLGGERFWVQILSIEGESIKAIVDNNLVYTGEHGVSLGDRISFEKRHIHQIWL